MEVSVHRCWSLLLVRLLTLICCKCQQVESDVLRTDATRVQSMGPICVPSMEEAGDAVLKGVTKVLDHHLISSASTTAVSSDSCYFAQDLFFSHRFLLGGRRCTYVGCSTSAQGTTKFCIAHGGGRRCQFNGAGGCTKSAIAGPNPLCRKHGGGPRCSNADCDKSARAGYDLCAKHGGGKSRLIECIYHYLNLHTVL
jgi:hypothetical protein